MHQPNINVGKIKFQNYSVEYYINAVKYIVVLGMEKTLLYGIPNQYHNPNNPPSVLQDNV